MQPLLQRKGHKYCIFWECICSRMQCAVFYCCLWPARLYNIFSTLSHKRHDFRKKILNYETCFDFLYTFCLKHFSFWEELREVWSKIFIGLHVKYPLFLSDFNETWIFSTKVQKILKYRILWKFVQCGLSCCMRSDGQTDMRKIIVAFRNFAKAPKMLYYYRPRYRSWLILSFFLVFSHCQVYGFLIQRQ